MKYLSFLIFCSLFCYNVYAKSNMTLVEDMIGNTYYGCKVVAISENDKELEITCKKNKETVVISIYTLENNNDIKKEIIDILEYDMYEDF